MSREDLRIDTGKYIVSTLKGFKWWRIENASNGKCYTHSLDNDDITEQELLLHAMRRKHLVEAEKVADYER